MTHWIRVAEVSDCPPGAARELVVEDKIVALFNIDGELVAVDGICPHQGGPLARGQINDGAVTCPWHGWRFQLVDRANGAGATNSLICYPVKTEGADILIAMESEC